MKSTGIVRRLDPLGRFCIPIEIRKMLELEISNSLEVFIDDEYIILKKYEPQNACLLTGDVSSQNLILGDGSIILTPKAAELLFEELQHLKESKHFGNHVR
ncbi:AbrB/MazE/SpoVT family DNA-binding domain-containing protein [Peribacillus frigoritolerans]|uniref:AbrB/MazE/SpoVT family DNA-binding domain-containing protein n=1 Tax=Peribacillus frigoritolerans TaxID=450367 RepID=UPI001070BBC5|nr:AbrB/MazE/SpoVT family DNA-binding domain-containing protein [Peribacillus frigoritolerans]TFH61932.1 hypothetical protein E4J71_10925 [Peribacillus frigoritolerans]